MAIPDKIERFYYSVPDAARICKISTFKVRNIIEEMTSQHMVRISRNGRGSYMLKKRHLELIKKHAPTYRSIL